MQVEALKRAGCTELIIDEGVNGAKISPRLRSAARSMAAGDILLLPRLDRISRDQGTLIDFADDLFARGIGIRALDEPAETQALFDMLNFIVPFSGHLDPLANVAFRLSDMLRAFARRRVARSMFIRRHLDT